MLRTVTVLALLASFYTVHSQDHLDQLIANEKKQFRTSDQRMVSVSSPNYDVVYYRCHWNLDPASTYIKGSVTTHFKIVAPSASIVMDMGASLNIDSIIYHGTSVTYAKLPNDGLQINFPAMIAQGIKDSVSIYYQGVPTSVGFGSFNRATHAGVQVVWSLSEPYGAKTWWPCKDLLEDKADSIDIIIANPIAFRSSSNGLPVTEIATPTHRITHWRHRYPIATYLVAFAVTNYDVNHDVAQSRGKSIPLALYTYPEQTSVYLPILTTTKEAMTAFSDRFEEYPFANERYAQTQFSWGGGMEHQTNTFISGTSKLLIAHELGHHWFGDMVTCGSWQDLWLNEGFATYTEYIYTENFNASQKLPMLTSWKNTITSAPNGSVFVPDTTNVNRLFSGRLTYLKGGYVVHMLRWKLGDSAFYRGVRRYLNDPALRYKTAKTADLKRNLETESGKNLTEFFEDWVYGEGYPDYWSTWTRTRMGKIKVVLSQTTSHASVDFFEMPVPLNFKNATRDTTIVVDHKNNAQVFEVDPGFVPDTMMIDPQLWILSKTKTTQQLPRETGDNAYIFPNPSSGNFSVVLPNNQPQAIKVGLYNSLGQLIYTIDAAAGSSAVNFYSTHLSSGVYWVRITGTLGLNETRRVLVTR